MDRYTSLAETIMLRGIKEPDLISQWEYRKGKSFEDVRNAVHKGKKKGLGKFEREAMEIGFALERVINPKAFETTEPSQAVEGG